MIFYCRQDSLTVVENYCHLLGAPDEAPQSVTLMVDGQMLLPITGRANNAPFRVLLRVSKIWLVAVESKQDLVSCC